MGLEGKNSEERMELRIREVDEGEGEAALRQAQGPNFRVTKARVKQPFGRLRDQILE